MRISRKTLVTAAAFAASLAIVALPAVATTIVPACARNQGTAAPSLECVLQTFRNVANLIIGVTGSFALLMFVYGGFTFITSAGNEKKVSAGKTILRNAIIGIILIFSSGYVIDYVVDKLTAGQIVTAPGDNTCNGGLGKYTTANDGTRTCVTTCTNAASLGYSCVKAGSGEDCNAEYTGCPGGTICCVAPRGAPPAAQPSTTPAP